MTKATPTKANIWLGQAYRFRGLVQYFHSSKHEHAGRRGAREELRVLHLEKAARRRMSSRHLGGGSNSPPQQ